MGLNPAERGAWVAGRIEGETKTLLGLIVCPAWDSGWLVLPRKIQSHRVQ